MPFSAPAENCYRIRLWGAGRAVKLTRLYGPDIEQAAGFVQHLLRDALRLDPSVSTCFYYERTPVASEFVIRCGKKRIKVRLELCVEG